MIGSLISAGASILGGIMGNNAAKDAAKQNAALQREFAQNSLQWKAADAAKAGIHPLYAMGAPTYSATPTNVGDNSFGAGIANAGQDIGRAIDATRTAPQKLQATRATQLELERQGLVNDNLRADLAVKAAQSARTPAFPAAVDPYSITGQANSGVKPVAMERIANAHAPWSEPGTVASYGWEDTGDGGRIPVPSKDLKDRTEDSPYELEHWIRNRLGPFVRYHREYRDDIKRGKAWWDPATGAYYRR